MAVLTEWEEKHLVAIADLIDDVERNEKEALSSHGASDGRPKWILFRNYMMGLYSLLDFVWYFLYCHFCNKGEADRSSEIVMCLNFPFAHKGVKVVAQKPESPHDMRNKFCAEKAKLVLKENTIASVWVGKVVGSVILEAQRTLETKENGDTEAKPSVPTPNSSAESLFLLHYYRNCVTHREFVHIDTTNMWVKVNRATRETEIVEVKEEDTDQYYCLRIERGDWVKIPDDLIQVRSHGYRPLQEVLRQLKAFVLSTIGKLLYSTRVISSQSEILACEGLTEFHCKRDQLYCIRITVDGYTFDTTKNSEEECCTELLRLLQQKQIAKTHQFFVPTYTALPFAPVEVEMKDGKPWSSMLNEMKQKLRNCGAPANIIDSQLTDNAAFSESIRMGLVKLILPKSTLHHELGSTFLDVLTHYKKLLESQHKFVVDLCWNDKCAESLHFEMSIETSVCLRLKSAQYSDSDMSAAKEKAARNLILKLKALKFIELVSEIPVIEIELGQNKSEIKLLQEYRDKLQTKTNKLRVDLNDPDPTKIEEQLFSSRVTLSINRIEQDGKEVTLESFSGEELRQNSKQKAKNSAASKILHELQNKGLINMK